MKRQHRKRQKVKQRGLWIKPGPVQKKPRKGPVSKTSSIPCSSSNLKKKKL